MIWDFIQPFSCFGACLQLDRRASALQIPLLVRACWSDAMERQYSFRARVRPARIRPCPYPRPHTRGTSGDDLALCGGSERKVRTGMCNGRIRVEGVRTDMEKNTRAENTMEDSLWPG